MLLVADILFKMKLLLLLLLLLLPCAALPMPAHRTRSPVPLLARQVLHEASSVIQAASWKVYVAAETAAETERDDSRWADMCGSATSSGSNSGSSSSSTGGMQQQRRQRRIATDADAEDSGGSGPARQSTDVYTTAAEEKDM